MQSVLETEADVARGLHRDQRGGVIASIINLVFGFILAVIALRFVFRLLGANPVNGLVSIVYELSAPLVAPFAGIFGRAEADLAAARFELATLVALVVYGLVAAILNGVLAAGHRRVTY